MKKKIETKIKDLNSLVVINISIHIQNRVKTTIYIRRILRNIERSSLKILLTILILCY